MNYIEIKSIFSIRKSTRGRFFSIYIIGNDYPKPIGLLTEILSFLKEDLNVNLKNEYSYILRHLNIEKKLTPENISLSEKLNQTEPYRYKNQEYTFHLISNCLIFLSKYFRDQNSKFNYLNIILDDFNKLDLYSHFFLKIATREKHIRIYTNKSKQIDKWGKDGEIKFSTSKFKLKDITKKGIVLKPDLESFNNKQLIYYLKGEVKKNLILEVDHLTDNVYSTSYSYTSSGFYTTSTIIVESILYRDIKDKILTKERKLLFYYLLFINYCSTGKVKNADEITKKALKLCFKSNTTSYIKWLYFQSTLHLRYFKPSSPLSAIEIINLIEKEITSSQIQDLKYVSAFVLNTKALSAFQLKNYSLAENLCKQAISVLKNDKSSKAIVEKGTFFFNLSQLYYSQGKLTKSIYFIEKAQKLEPQYPDYHLIKGNCYFELREFHKAYEYYKRYSNLGIKSPEFYNNFILLIQMSESKEDLSQIINDILLIYPDNLDLMLNVSSYLIDINSLNFAKKVLLIAKFFNKENGQIYNNLGRVYHDNKEYTNAILNYKKAIKLDDNLIDSYINLSCLYYEILEIENAIKYINYAYKIDSNNDEVTNNKAFLENFKKNE